MVLFEDPQLLIRAESIIYIKTRTLMETPIFALW